ncbi:MAG: hypothetical protein M3321_03625 [Actinomycetota bacterium]|nr:hypothetical protein [Actinomycetota bacterium]
MTLTADERPATIPAFERDGGLAAIGVAVAGLLYALAFVIFDDELTSGLFLLLTGLLTIVAITAAYLHVRGVEPGFALLALLLGAIGGAGAAAHGGWDLAYEIESEAPGPAVPNFVDPRGLLTFGFTGLAVLLIAWLASRGGVLPARLALLGYALGALLVLLYLARLIVVDSDNPLVAIPALLSGFLAGPAWWLWLGLELRRAAPRDPATVAA